MKWNIILGLAIAIASVSCTKLVETDRSSISIEEYYLSESDLNGGCLTLYPDLGTMQYHRMLNSMGSIGITYTAAYTSHSSGLINANDNFNTLVWTIFYKCISQANFTIENIEQSPVNQQIKDKYLAEAKAVRAFVYLRMVKLWGDIPYRTKLENSSTNLAPTPMAQVYENIISDLRWAEDKCHEPGWQKGRIDKTVVKALLADAYLTCATSAKSYNPATTAKALKPYHDAFSDKIDQYYNYVLELTSEIISGSSYKLLAAPWSNLWGVAPTYDHRNNVEFLFALQSQQNFVNNNHFYTPNYSEWAYGNNGAQGWCMSYEYVKSFDAADFRGTQFMFGYKQINTSVAEPSNPNLPNNRYRYMVWFRSLGDKYKEVTVDDLTAANGGKNYIEEDGRRFFLATHKELYPIKFYDKRSTDNTIFQTSVIPYYRMAEVYLWAAEAENELNGMTPLAASRINAIRERVGLNRYNAGQFSKTDFRKHLIDEYLWEFGFEAKDFHVLQRFGQLTERCEGVEVVQNVVPVPGNTTNSRIRVAENYWLAYPGMERSLNKKMLQYRMDFE